MSRRPGRRRHGSTPPRRRPPEPPAPPPGPLDHAVADAEQALQRLAGDASHSSISRSGEPVDAVKYHEGRLAAATEARRVARRLGPDAQREEVVTVVETLRSTWAAEHRRAVEDELGPGWIGYRAGGVDQLEELRERLSG